MLNFFLQRQKPASIGVPHVDKNANGGLIENGGVRQRKKYTEGIPMSEVSKHNTKEDCWMVIEDKVYDVTSWIDKHPGGEALILSYAGLDATDVFDAFHAESSYKILPVYYIGDVTDYVVPLHLKEHRQLRRALKEQDYFHSSKLFYTYKMMFNLGLGALAFIFLINWGASYWGKALAIGALTFFWQQCGWLSHDFLHHQVFKQRKYNNYAGYFFGNLCLGFSVGWWKNKHNLHHAVPNVAGFDPDIDTLPFLAWSESLIEGELTGIPHFLVRFQYIFIFPLLALARISWLIQSVLFAASKVKKYKKVELATLTLHYAWVGYLSFGFLNFWEGVAFILISQFFTGMMLAVAFSLNHNGMSILDDNEGMKTGEMDFSKIQVITGRDVKGGPFNFFHWFMGGLDMQIEHHLFPGLPRHNLKKIQEKVETQCRQHDIKYHQTGFWEGLKECVGRLRDVSEKVITGSGSDGGSEVDQQKLRSG